MDRKIGTLIFGLVVFLGCLGFLIYQSSWIRSAFAGPQPISTANLVKVKRVEQMATPWITIQADEIRDTGIGIVTQRNGVETDSTKFSLLKMGNKYLIAELPTRHAGNGVTGYVDHWQDSFVKLRRDALEKVTHQFPEAKGKLLPFQMDADYGYARQCYAMLGVMSFFGLIGLGLAITGVIQLIQKPGKAIAKPMASARRQ
ncbi:MAG: hypothetical protein U0744_01765 [Gemmataceae bacterium]